MTYHQKLDQAILTSNSLLCIGMDPDLSKIPMHLMNSEDPVFDFCRAVIEATKDTACAYKFNIAFFEVLGEKGWETLRALLPLLPAHAVSIADAKVGDIGNSSDKYAETFFDEFEFDCVTVAPYMGSDSVQPFIRREDKGIFLLGLTSNPGSADFQRLKLENGKFLYQEVADKAVSWNGLLNVGLVTGATHSEDLKELRDRVGDLPFLVPGIGAQGGDLGKTVRNAVNRHSRGALINVGRDILYASGEENFNRIVNQKAHWYQEQINHFRFTISV